MEPQAACRVSFRGWLARRGRPACVAWTAALLSRGARCRDGRLGAAGPGQDDEGRRDLERRRVPVPALHAEVLLAWPPFAARRRRSWLPDDRQAGAGDIALRPVGRAQGLRRPLSRRRRRRPHTTRSAEPVLEVPGSQFLEAWQRRLGRDRRHDRARSWRGARSRAGGSTSPGSPPAGSWPRSMLPHTRTCMPPWR